MNPTQAYRTARADPGDGRDPGPEDPRVIGAVEEYLAALEAGRAPSREEFLARHAAIADRLGDYLAGLELIHRAGPAAGATVDPDDLADDRAGSEPLGDFALVREVGRGGMGVVYQATQRSLGRRVALKVLPFAATMDPRQLQRFHNEARAAASLDHPHIVHVYAVGCERGVHYYAMQFIEGQTLAAVIAGMRQAGGRLALPEAQPTTPHTPGQPDPAPDTAPVAAASTERAPKDGAHFRRVAEWGIQAAEALDHAHQLGVVHRDVKPANLLVDGRGGLWVTDFGLAHIQSDARLTMTGDLVGTLRYMSPEQALAKRVVVDHRTDVYSLGATLYELLTLEPAFGGSDRQELLRQIAFDEPVPPRRMNRGVPGELETIVLKALEKNPADRYGTAKELADDLRRFLADEPIRARPAGMVRRLRKWGRRHPAAVAAAAAALTAAVAVLSGGIGWVANDRATRTLRTSKEIVTALKESEEWQQKRRVPEALSAARRGMSALAGGHADLALRLQVEARVKDLLLLETLENARLEGMTIRDGQFDDQQVDTLYRKAFRGAGLDVESLPSAEAGALLRQTTVAADLAARLDNWACIRWRVKGRNDPSWKHFLAVARAADPDPARARVREVLERRDRQELQALAASEEASGLPPATLEALGDALWNAGAAEQTVKLFREAQRRFPDDFFANRNLADRLSKEEAVPYYLATVVLRPDNGPSHASLGYALLMKKDIDQAIIELRRSLDLDTNHASAHSNLGSALREKGDLDGALAEYRKAIDVDPKFPLAYANVGVVLHAKGDLAGAIRAYHMAIELNPELAGAYCNLGNVLLDKNDLDGAIAADRRAIDIDPKAGLPEGGAHLGLGNALYRKNDLDGALAAYRRAIDCNPRYAGAYYNLGSALADKNDLGGAIAAYRRAIEINPKLAAAYYDLGNALYRNKDVDGSIVAYRMAIALKKDYALAHHNLGSVLREKGDLDGAIAALRVAVGLEKGRVESHCDLGTMLFEKGQFAEALTYLRRGQELGSKDPRWTSPCAPLIKRCEGLVEVEPKLPALLRGKVQPANDRERAEYADLCQIKRLYAAAARLYQEAITAAPSLVASPDDGIRYNAACAAAQAGCGQGQDAGRLSDEERAGLRKQALDWLSADLRAWRSLLDKGPAQNRPATARQLAHWLEDTDLSGVRGPEALAKLPEAERQPWRTLWADLAATLAQAQRKDRSPVKTTSPADAPTRGGRGAGLPPGLPR